MEPWLRKLDEAINDLLRDWCNTGTTLAQAARGVRGFERARRREAAIEAHPTFQGPLRQQWRRHQTVLGPLEALRDWTHLVRATGRLPAKAFKWLFPSPEGLDEHRLEAIRDQCRHFREGLRRNAQVMSQHGQLEQKTWFGGGDISLGSLRKKLVGCAQSGVYLPVIARWSGLRAQVEERGLLPLAHAMVAREIDGRQAPEAFEYSLYHVLIERTFRNDPELAGFAEGQYENLRDDFARLEKQLMAMSAKEIARKLCTTAIPPGTQYGPVSTYTDRALILHEANKKKRHLPVRQLMARAGAAIQAAKPCFLMSPMSVAQYLPPEAMSFDLVVMDEASQIRPEDALGAIARGGRIVIVGDPKQLPPTRFFDSTGDDDEDAEETVIDDTESILDVCLTKLPFRRLRWHYRSQHESLIQFSNEQFYDGDLLVFPSPRRSARDLGGHFNYVTSPSYKQGRNRGEAKAVVEGVVRELRAHPDRSIGVAALNKRQAEETQALLDRVRQQHPDLEARMDGVGVDAPLFVKNLENVQGDERDVIFISTTYGPEVAGGPVAQRFGPINSDVGWRRLNVIATRARQRVEVYSSMQPRDVKLGDGARKGVRAFRDYLEYASTGRVTAPGVTTGNAPDSEFEVAVSSLIRNLGYEAVPQVGVAGFYIDIGVAHPDRPGEFLLGIECDGAAYHSAFSVRDRDRLRQEILEGKGWYIHRIWSTSWFHARGAEVDRLRRVIEELLRKDRSRRPAVPPRESLVPEDSRAVGVDFAEDSERTEDAGQQEGEISELLSEEDSQEADLETALNRFWESNIKPDFPDRSRSLLSPPIVKALVREMPISQDEWLRHVPAAMRMNIVPREGVFLNDVLALIAEYA